jgi:hypothetical protein
MKYLPAICLVSILACCQNDKVVVQENGNIKINHSLTAELKVLHDISSLPSFLDSAFTSQVSSYDTTWNNDDGFSGRYSFIQRNEDSTLVIFDVKGRGVITRIWTPTPTGDTLDFYIDSNIDPSFSIKYSDLFSGKQYPFVAPLCGNQLGGFYCYLPIPFAESCKIVSRGKRLQFHQLQYRLYSDNATVKSFNPALNNEEKEAMGWISALWSKKDRVPRDFYPEELMQSTGTFELRPGDVKQVLNIDRPALFRRLKV